MKAQDSTKGWPEGWLVAAAAAVLAAVMARLVGEVGLFAAFMIAVFVFLVFGVLLGMFWGTPVTVAPGAHAAQGHGHGHGDEHGAGTGVGHGHAAEAAAVPAAAPVPVASPIAEAAAAKAIAAEEAAPLPADPVAAPEAVATDDGMAHPPVAQALMAEPAAVVAEPEALMAEPAAAVAEPNAVVEAEPASGGVSKPAGLTAPRGGVADKLQVIEGIGPALEKLCHDLGIYHFDQIAGWGAAEVAWMDGNLKGFKGRVTRDKWVRQAALINEVGVDEFLRRAKTNDY